MQYCMPYPREYLAATQHHNVVTIRASNDYHAGRDQWMISKQSILAHATGVLPFKDTFNTNRAVEAGGADASAEINNDLQTLVATLSASIVAPGDGLNYLNMTALMQCCRSDGVVLKADRPAVPLESQWTTASPGGEVGFTSATVGNRAFCFRSTAVAVALRPWFCCCFVLGGCGHARHSKVTVAGISRGPVTDMVPSRHASRAMPSLLRVLTACFTRGLLSTSACLGTTSYLMSASASAYSVTPDELMVDPAAAEYAQVDYATRKAGAFGPSNPIAIPKQITTRSGYVKWLLAIVAPVVDGWAVFGDLTKFVGASSKRLAGTVPGASPNTVVVTAVGADREKLECCAWSKQQGLICKTGIAKQNGATATATFAFL